jgi:hypothetical protein
MNKNFIETNAFVIKQMRYNETSKIINLFSEELGIFSALVKGVRNCKSKYSGVYELFNKIKIQFHKKENISLQKIYKAELLNSYGEFRDDLDRIEIGFRSLELIGGILNDFDKNSEIYLIFEKFLRLLNKSNVNCYKVYIDFLIDFSDFCGISVKSENFYNKNFVTYFNETFSSEIGYNILKTDMISLHQYINNSGKNLSFNESDIENFCNILETYILYHFGIKKNKRNSQSVFKELKSIR